MHRIFSVWRYRDRMISFIQSVFTTVPKLMNKQWHMGYRTLYVIIESNQLDWNQWISNLLEFILKNITKLWVFERINWKTGISRNLRNNSSFLLPVFLKSKKPPIPSNFSSIFWWKANVSVLCFCHTITLVCRFVAAMSRMRLKTNYQESNFSHSDYFFTFIFPKGYKCSNPMIPWFCLIPSTAFSNFWN